jgi:hypothetical protein
MDVEDLDIGGAPLPIVFELAERIFEAVGASLAKAPPAGLSAAEVRSMLAQHRADLEARLVGQLTPFSAKIQARLDAKGGPAVPPGIPEAWTPAQRTRVNIDAMRLLTSGAPLGPRELAIVRGYSGWGGLSIERARPHLPEGVPVPKAEGLIHEFYTPTRVYAALAASLGQLGLIRPAEDGQAVRALEPSAGIGRAVDGFRSVPGVAWTLVEPSPVSGRLLRALYPSAELFDGYFEAYVAANPRARFDLVVSNPPYGVRGASAELDPAPGYRTSRAYLYFIFRALDLLRAGGVAAFIVPTGFLTGTGAEMTRARERVLRRHHLLGAFRLPSVPPEGGTRADVVYDNFVVDLLIFEARGGTLADVEPSDLEVAAGGYYKAHPEHVLGEPEGVDAGWEPGQPKPRRGFQLRGRFDGLPDWTPRPLRGEVQPDEALGARATARDRGGIARQDVELADLPPHVEGAIALGKRVDAYLAAVAAADEAALRLHPELVLDLGEWVKANGDPAKDAVLAEAARRRSVGAQRFLAAFERGRLAPAVADAPKIEPRYQGDLTVPGIAAWLFRRAGKLTTRDLCAWWERHTRAAFDCDAAVADLVARGWCLDGDRWDELLPPEAYLTGFLWPRYDRAKARAAAGDDQAQAQVDRLARAIGWRSGPDILKDCRPIDSWLPLGLVERFAEAHIGEWRGKGLVRANGLLSFPLADGTAAPISMFNNTDKGRTNGFSREALSFIGWANFDKGLWNPEREKRIDPATGNEENVPIHELREKQAEGWNKTWREWIAADDALMEELEQAYNRQLRGYIEPVHDDSPVPLDRWKHRKGFSLKPHQNAAVRKYLHHGSLLLGFDVGVGKTYTGIASILAARQEGRARRPVVLVPNTLTWKWYRDFQDAAPDLRVLVIGSERFTATARPEDGEAELRVAPKAWLASNGARRRLAAALVEDLAAAGAGARVPVAALVERHGGGALAQLRKLESEGAIALRTPRQAVKARPDSPEARAAKWTAFQAGQADVVLLTYSALARTQIDPGFVERYVEKTIALRRSIELSIEAEDQKELLTAARGGPKKLTERNEAVMEARVRGWVGEVLAPPKRWVYDPGIDWHQLGIDMLVVDEAQNFKNLFASAQESAADKAATKRAWALDFRCASVREHTGGTGVLLLSATPAKNAAVEFYTMVHLLRPDAWEQVGIDNPEAFIGRFGRFKKCEVMDPSGQKTVVRDVLTGFQNTEELRAVLDRWALFKTAEEAGLKLPAVRLPSPHVVRVTPAQADKLADAYAELAEIEETIKNAARSGLAERDPSRMKALLLKKTSIATRIYLTYLHPDLPGLTKSGASPSRFDPADGPKLVECADTIVKGSARACQANGEGEEFCLGCGHIVFVDNIAVHGWMKRLLIDRGVPAERIAILNAEEVPDTEARQQIAERFNGVGAPGDEVYEAPSIDVVIANAVAYEGMDLNRRTCAVHHLDVPWEPATLQQRNGRAVRQGNLFAEIEIHYYFVEGSNEPWRVQRIERKRGWMAEIVAGQRRDTNTTGESDGCTQIGEEERDDDLQHARPEDRERIRRARAEAREQARRQRIVEGQIAANKNLWDVVENIARGRRLKHGTGETDAARGEALQAEAIATLTQLLQDVPDGLYPPELRWRAQAERLLDPALLDSPLVRVAAVPERGPVLFPGDRVRIGQEFEVGQVFLNTARELMVGLVSGSGAFPSARDAKGMKLLEDGLGVDANDDPGFGWVDSPTPLAPSPARYAEDLGRMNHALGWKMLAPSTQERLWPEVARSAAPELRTAYMWWSPIPVELGGRLVLLHQGVEPRALPERIRLPPGATFIPPTPSGWLRFQALVPTARGADGKPLKVTDAREAARYWWGWELPKNVRPEGSDA